MGGKDDNHIRSKGSQHLPLKELLDSLITHELIMKQNIEDESKKRKMIALKSIAKEEEESEDLEEGDGDDELTLITRKFKRFMKKKRSNFKRRPFSNGEPSKEKDKDKDKVPPTYFKCKKLGHFKMDCPLLNKSSKKIKQKGYNGHLE